MLIAPPPTHIEHLVKYKLIQETNTKKGSTSLLVSRKYNIDTEYNSAAIMFDPDGIVVTSLAVTYLTLKNESKVNQGHCH